MSISFKRTAAAAAAIICAASLSGCVDSGYIGSVDDVRIRNGLYLWYEISAINNANTEVSDAKAEYGDTSEVADIFVESIDGKDAISWIKEDAMSSVKRFVAVRRLFEQYGLSLTAEDTDYVNDNINSAWNEESFYAQYIYGTKTVGEYYESIGISKETMRELYTNNRMEKHVFLHYYDTDGLTPVSDEEFNSYLSENYANVKYIRLEFTDKFGISLKEDDEIQAVKDLAQSYADRLNAGEDFVDIQYDFDLYIAQREASADAEDAYVDETAEELPDFDTYIQNAVDAATAEKRESSEELEVVISKETSSLDADLTGFIWSAPDDGSASLYETDTAVYVVERDDITSKEKWITDNRTSVLSEMRDDEFDEVLESVYANYAVETDDYLVNTKYAPDKIRGIND